MEHHLSAFSLGRQRQDPILIDPIKLPKNEARPKGSKTTRGRLESWDHNIPAGSSSTDFSHGYCWTGAVFTTRHRGSTILKAHLRPCEAFQLASHSLCLCYGCMLWMRFDKPGQEMLGLGCERLRSGDRIQEAWIHTDILRQRMMSNMCTIWSCKYSRVLCLLIGLVHASIVSGTGRALCLKALEGACRLKMRPARIRVKCGRL